MSEILENPVFWVVASFATFIALAIYKKLPKLLLSSLDSRAAKIKEELDTARNLRQEAEAVLDDYKQKQAQYLQEAEKMLAKARIDADVLRAQAEKDMISSLDDRMKSALERIAMEEAKSLVAVRERVVEMAMTTARTLIADRAANNNASASIHAALGDIEAKIG